MNYKTTCKRNRKFLFYDDERRIRRWRHLPDQCSSIGCLKIPCRTYSLQSFIINESSSNVQKLWFMLIFLGGQTLHYRNKCINPDIFGIRITARFGIPQFSSLYKNDLRGQLWSVLFTIYLPTKGPETKYDDGCLLMGYVFRRQDNILTPLLWSAASWSHDNLMIIVWLVCSRFCCTYGAPNFFVKSLRILCAPYGSWEKPKLYRDEV